MAISDFVPIERQGREAIHLESAVTMLGFFAVGKRSRCSKYNRRPKAPAVPFPHVSPA
jgi:hypothetical protein